MKLNEAHQGILTDLINELGLQHVTESVNLADLTWDEYREALRTLESIRDQRENLALINQIINNEERY